jgi:hypothetical protein
MAEPESASYFDGNVFIGQTYYYRIASLDDQGNRSEYSRELAIEIMGVEENAELPQVAAIETAYPNPFNSSTTIVYKVADLGPVPAQINIDIYDIQGRKVRALVDERKEVGIHRIVWDGKGNSGEDAPSGIYFARISQWGLDLGGRPRKITLLR